MALEAIRENLEGLNEQEQAHYNEVEKDGKKTYHLDVTPVEGMSLENVTGLKSTVEKLRSNERTLQADLDKINKKFEDIDPDQARTAIAKYDEVKNWNGDQKVQEAVAASKVELIKAHKKAKDELENELAETTTQLQEALVTTKIVEALQKEEGNVDLLLPHVKLHVEMAKDKDGKFHPEVVNKEGHQRVGDSDGNPMTILQYVQEMKTQKSFAAGFAGANSTGSGNSGQDDGGTPKKTNKGKTIPASDGKAMSNSIEDIASGKSVVAMDK